MVSNCQVQQILAKPGLYHTTISTSYASIGNCSVEEHGPDLTKPPFLQRCNNSIALAASPILFRSFGTLRSCYACRPNTKTGNWSTCSLPVISGNILPSKCTTRGKDG